MVQKSLDMKQWNTIAIEEISDHKDYHYIDNDASAGLNYYRIGIVNKETGSITYSNIDYVKLNDRRSQLSEIKLFPNPNSGSFIIEIDNSTTVKEMIILNQLGKKVEYSRIDNDDNINLQLNNCTAGYYSIRIIGDDYLKSGSFIIH